MAAALALLALALGADAPDGTVESYVARALEDSPRVEAAFHRWQSSVHAVARERTLPEPTVSFGTFVQSVETRVGPQQAKVSVQQAFPWPTRLVQGGKAARAASEGAEAELQVTSLEVAAAVEVAFWSLWETRQTAALHREHLAVLDGLSATVAARMETGSASLADLQQVDLTRARLDDTLASLAAREDREQARLLATVGRRDGEAPTTSQPEMAPAGEVDALVERALAHPRLDALDASARSADHQARAMGGRRLPDLTVGADWILTGPAVMDTPDDGKDAVAVGVGVKVPLWQGTYGHEVASARARQQAARASERATGDQLVAEVHALTAEVDDTARRVDLIDSTLLPQAEAAYGSVLGQYTVGEGSVAQALLAQRDLLDLAIDRAAAQAAHRRAWARLHAVVGGAE